MSSGKNFDKILKTYKFLTQFPALVSAKIINDRNVESVWSQRSLDRGKIVKFMRSIRLTPDLNKETESISTDVSNELLRTTNSSEDNRAVLRDLDNKQYLEIWKNNNLSHCVDLNALDVHGNVYSDGEFDTFEWSPDSKKLLYIAEMKVPKSEPFYKRGSKDVEKPKGEEYLYRQDWGEQMTGKVKSVIAQYDLETDNVEILPGIPTHVCPAQVRYSPNGDYVVGVAYKTEPRKLGLIYCSNRESTIFKLDFNGNYIELPLKNQSVKSPKFTPDGETLIWMQRSAGGPHGSVMSLMKTTALPLTENSEAVVVVDAVQSESQTQNGTKFYGLYNTGYPKRCFASNNQLLLSSNQKNTINTYLIEIDTGKIFELKYAEGSQIVLDVVNGNILLNRRNFLKQDQLVIANLQNNCVDLTISNTIDGLENCIYEYLDLAQSNDETCNQFSAIYIGPKCGERKSTSLIVWPHGGPHSAYANNLSLEAALFLSLGYAVLLINYRGSIGAGGDSVNFLLGKIGKSDVADCMLAVDTALERYQWLDSDKLVLVGGSHGGFLVTHLSGQFPDKFKAVVARNPVIDVASMSAISDIPDWCYAEAGSKYTQAGEIDDTVLMAMRKASPIQHAHKVKAPTLLQIGSKDLRVPPHQGVEYYTRLKANGVPVRMNLYDDNHPLGSVPNEMDNLINSMLWIELHLE